MEQINKEPSAPLEEGNKDIITIDYRNIKVAPTQEYTRINVMKHDIYVVNNWVIINKVDISAYDGFYEFFNVVTNKTICRAGIKNGQFHGVVLTYYKSGDINTISHYDSGDLKYCQGYNEKGEQILEGEMCDQDTMIEDIRQSYQKDVDMNVITSNLDFLTRSGGMMKGWAINNDHYSRIKIIGTFINIFESSYEDTTESPLLRGHGTLEYRPTTIYEEPYIHVGNFANGPRGYGVRTYKYNNIRLEGEFVPNGLVSGKKYKNNVLVYEGPFKDNKPVSRCIIC